MPLRRPIMFCVRCGEHFCPDQCGGLHQPRLCRCAQHHEGCGLCPYGRGPRKRCEQGGRCSQCSRVQPLLETKHLRRARCHHQHYFLARYWPDDVERAATLITNSAHPDANIIWGAAFDESMKDEMCITVIATGFEAGAGEAEAVPAAAVAGHEAAQQYAFTSEKAPVQQAQPVAQPQPEPVAAPALVAPAPEPRTLLT